ncbi:hypothetical protein [Paenibacillus glufosinatiresistens]|uniref:hypothetical protein n=1 Tax=Paenibacillus glufosinatiresistens TaxID=3070657 RepID=UPI00286DFFCB|nr:hypothetical protein [Paenibacillus sp. YX.27]
MKKRAYILSVLVLLLLTLVSTASTGGTFAVARSAAADQAAPAETYTVYLKAFHTDGNGFSVTTDPIDWYEGKAADAMFAKEDPESYREIGGAPDGYYIVNDSDNTITYPVAADASVKVQLFDHTGDPADLDIQWNEPVNLGTFIGQFASSDVIDLGAFPYHITVQNGQIISIVQQYVP